jgi:hypothetical protein
VNVTYSTGFVDPPSVSVSWVLILGGVTRHGNRRARRVAVQMLKDGLDVVWFDGFEERDVDSGSRVPLEVPDVHPEITIVGYRDAEDRSLAGRLRTGSGLKANPFTRAMWKLVLRRIGTVLRPRAGWKAIKPEIEMLAAGPAPRLIVYCDVYAITSAWYAGNQWTSTPILSGLPERQP